MRLGKGYIIILDKHALGLPQIGNLLQYYLCMAIQKLSISLKIFRFVQTWIYAPCIQTMCYKKEASKFENYYSSMIILCFCKSFSHFISCIAVDSSRAETPGKPDVYNYMLQKITI